LLKREISHLIVKRSMGGKVWKQIPIPH
jgi:hypothetical protein